MEHQQPTYEHKDQQKRRKKRLFIVWAVVLPITLVVIFVFAKTSNILTIAGGGVGKYENFEVEDNPNRLDILILGIGGPGHEGGLLTDTMIVASFDKQTGEAAMVSLPRDLFVEMPEHHSPERINYAYALGEERVPNGGGLLLSKEVTQYVTGVYIDHAIVVNFDGFRRLVNTLGGVTIHRPFPFTESQQWQGEGNPDSPYWVLVNAEEEAEESVEELEKEEPVETEEGEQEQNEGEVGAQPQEAWQFHIPAGTHTLGGSDALYYVRSRYDTSDFDRARRQQEVLSAIKEKSLSLGVITNPVKVFDMLDALGDNVRTDMGLGNIREVVSILNSAENIQVKNSQLDTSEEGLLVAANINGAFVLLPRVGDGDFTEIREFFGNIFEE